MNHQPFLPPSKFWVWFFYPFTLVSIGFTVYHAYFLVYIGPVSMLLKYKLIAGVISIFVAFYLLMGYRYLLWVGPKKNQLYQLVLQSNQALLRKEFGRVHLNENIILAFGDDPLTFKGMRQRELREVYGLQQESRNE